MEKVALEAGKNVVFGQAADYEAVEVGNLDEIANMIFKGVNYAWQTLSDFFYEKTTEEDEQNETDH